VKIDDFAVIKKLWARWAKWNCYIS
jgi:hypothetical protein